MNFLKKRRSLNSKGFSHVEMLMVVVLVLVLGGAGYYVFKENNKATTAHAGSYNYGYIGQASFTDGSTFSVAACKKNVSNTASLWDVYTKVTAGANVTASKYSFWFTDFSSKNLNTSDIISNNTITSWSKGVGFKSFLVNPAIHNYIWASVQLADKGGPYGTSGGFWFTPGKLAAC